jgi:hypothetical protein
MFVDDRPTESRGRVHGLIGVVRVRLAELNIQPGADQARVSRQLRITSP